MKKEKNLKINIIGSLKNLVTSKDLILYIIGKIGTSGGTGYTIEYTGPCIRELSIESRMTICNMSIEAGSKSGIIGFDEKTLEYLLQRQHISSNKYIDKAIKYWETLKSDDESEFDKTINIDASLVEPQVTWGTSPQMTTSVHGKVPDPNTVKDKGGTFFSNYSRTVDAVEGRCVIWPADWTHFHKGIPSPTETKYIATGWFVHQEIPGTYK